MSDYLKFLKSKAIVSHDCGVTQRHEPNASMFPVQRDIVSWALRRGRAAIFADCGLGKTLCQLEWASQIPGNVIVLAPLSVAQQTVGEGAKFGIKAKYCRSAAQVEPGITVTNYEMLDKFDAGSFTGVVLDESSILKAFDGKTKTHIIDSFRTVPYRLACTATPAPNDHVELANHAEFLGVMTRSEMLATFFIHDGGDTSSWRLKGHAESEFWQWVCSWAVMIRKPSDLGYSDDGFTLPPIAYHDHTVEADPEMAAAAGLLFNFEAKTLQERRNARKSSIDKRVRAAADMINASRDPWIVWCNLNAEGDALTRAIPGSVQVCGADSNDQKSASMTAFTRGETRVLITKPSIAGFGMNWQHCAHVMFVGLSDSFEQFYQAVRRCWRFGQTRAVQCHIVTCETEGAVVANIRRKEADADKMAAEMLSHMRVINADNIRGASRQTIVHKPTREFEAPHWLRSES